MHTNYYGSKQVIKAMLPILRSTDCAGPRILIVASRCGQLKVEFSIGSSLYIAIGTLGTPNLPFDQQHNSMNPNLVNCSAFCH
jgi:hypothetical protein